MGKVLLRHSQELTEKECKHEGWAEWGLLSKVWHPYIDGTYPVYSCFVIISLPLPKRSDSKGLLLGMA